VENVSREIPLAGAVAEDEPPLTYFPSIADRVARRKGELVIEEGRCWGIAAAVLGKSENRHEFTQAFWWDRERSMQSYLRGIADGWDPAVAVEDGGEPGEDTGPPAVLNHEQAPRDLDEARRRWRSTRMRFRRVLDGAEEVRRELAEAREALLQREDAEAALVRARDAVLTSRLEVEKAEAHLLAAEAASEGANLALRDAAADRDSVLHLRPGFFARLFGTRSYREWRSRMSRVLAVQRQRRDEAKDAETHLDRSRQQKRESAAGLGHRRAEEASLAAKVEQIAGRIETARAQLADHFPDADFWQLPDERRQRLSPWLSEAFHAIREDVFASALDLHRAFIDAAARPLRHNLGAAMQLLKGRGLSSAQEPLRRSLWASLFLVVPVVSTTFASVARLFGPLGREQLGWLLIDEAGQAVPQAAVGAIWRSERVVAIGDPLQIEPVVTLPQRLIDAIFHEVGIDPDRWSAPGNSVQTLADRASWLGTRLSQDGGESWLGVPLRVHRRCEDPMFRISNRIAYDGLMVQATPSRHSAIGELIGNSTWFDVPGSQPGHWSEDEGKVAATILEVVLQRIGPEADLFFVTPFRLAAWKLRERLSSLIAKAAGAPPPWQWTKDRVGTIHTVQGREAEAVVLVLGAPSPQNAGARRWAGGAPNLLNVAVSRAKQRLYVVGSHEAWKDAGVFRALAAALPRHRVDADRHRPH
jgi:hypothetical protein